MPLNPPPTMKDIAKDEQGNSEQEEVGVAEERPTRCFGRRSQIPGREVQPSAGRPSDSAPAAVLGAAAVAQGLAAELWAAAAQPAGAAGRMLTWR